MQIRALRASVRPPVFGISGSGCITFANTNARNRQIAQKNRKDASNDSALAQIDRQGAIGEAP
jgi:hypothetical protein